MSGGSGALPRPTLDVVFKRLLMRKPVLLLDMLEGILGRSIRSLEIIASELPGDHVGDKGVVFDIRAELDDGTRVDLEMQRWIPPALRARLGSLASPSPTASPSSEPSTCGSTSTSYAPVTSRGMTKGWSRASSEGWSRARPSTCSSCFALASGRSRRRSRLGCGRRAPTGWMHGPSTC
ncbi:MAG: PD-(D/E)XK nuclease family transposase [Myxococcales bacterium]|nr:PD-(D/E)XK nuclease family transposase [Myxococcales bacterium]